MQKFGEVETSLWHAWAEILEWYTKLDSLMKVVDNGLGLLLGLNANSSGVQNKETLSGLNVLGGGPQKDQKFVNFKDR